MEIHSRFHNSRTVIYFHQEKERVCAGASGMADVCARCRRKICSPQSLIEPQAMSRRSQRQAKREDPSSCTQFSRLILGLAVVEPTVAAPQQWPRRFREKPQLPGSLPLRKECCMAMVRPLTYPSPGSQRRSSSALCLHPKEKWQGWRFNVFPCLDASSRPPESCSGATHSLLPTPSLNAENPGVLIANRGQGLIAQHL